MAVDEPPSNECVQQREDGPLATQRLVVSHFGAVTAQHFANARESMGTRSVHGASLYQDSSGASVVHARKCGRLNRQNETWNSSASSSAFESGRLAGPLCFR